MTTESRGRTPWSLAAALLGIVVGMPFYLAGFILGSVAGCFCWGFRKTWDSWGEANR